MRAITVPLMLGAALLSGCGNWSDEDILFKLAAPGKDTLRLRVPGAEAFEEAVSEGQALETGPCSGAEEGNITCAMRQIAGVFNGITFGLLAIVDDITSRDPTKREQGKRVWGPFFMDDKGFTGRFEMNRDADNGRFSYCLHVAAGNRAGLFADRNVKCGRNEGPFVEFFSGSFLPEESADPKAKRGMGEMALNLNNLGNEQQGRFTFTYDTREDKTEIDIHIDNIKDEETGLPASADYSYQRSEDGDGEMHLTLLKQLECPSFGNCAGSDPEELILGARWTAEGASRVDAQGKGGDLAGTVYRGWECAQADLQVVARHYDWEPAKDLQTDQEATLCPFPAIDVTSND